MTKRKPIAREQVIKGLHAGLKNAEILARVKKTHPKSPMTLATINYIRNDLRKTDKTVKSERALNKIPTLR